jgi:hypothetical protein
MKRVRSVSPSPPLAWRERVTESPLLPDMWREVGTRVHNTDDYLALTRVSVACFAALGSFVQLVPRMLDNNPECVNKMCCASDLFHPLRWQALTGRADATFEYDVMLQHMNQLPLAQHLRNGGLDAMQAAPDMCVAGGMCARSWCVRRARQASPCPRAFRRRLGISTCG